MNAPLPFSPSSIKVISFDLDDTLWACHPVILQAEQDLFVHCTARSPSFSLETLRVHSQTISHSHPHLSHDVSFIRHQALLRSFHGDDSLAREAFEVFYQARTKHVSMHLFPGAVDAVKELRKSYKIATITNGNAQVLKVPEMEHCVDFHVDAAMAGRAKPNKEPFDMVLKHFGVDPKEVLHVGDSYEADVVGGASVGMWTCWVKPGGGVVGERCEASLIVDSVVELVELLRQDRL